jgi:putative colanic acid biosynthesis glycosyltransferase WcaI
VRLTVVTPHFHPDVAPTGEVVTRIVDELAARDHEIHVVTAFPFYRHHRVEPPYKGGVVRHEDTPWGHITRVNPWPTDDKLDLVKRALSFAGFSALSAVMGARRGPVDGVLALSPPLTLGVSGWLVARAQRCPFVFNVQDVYPDVAIDLGMLTHPRLISATRRLERFCYARADAVTVLSEDLKENVARKVGRNRTIKVIPNFVDTKMIAPAPPHNSYRREFGLEDKIVVMYAGNVGLSQSLELLVEAAARFTDRTDVVFVVNGQGAARASLEQRSRDLPNVCFVDLQPPGRLAEVLAAADIHVVPLKRGLARSSVPSKTYSILAAGRPLVASVDEGSEVARIVQRSGAGIAVPPEDTAAFTGALARLIEDPETREAMGRAGRNFAEEAASPAAVALAYEQLFADLRAGFAHTS